MTTQISDLVSDIVLSKETQDLLNAYGLTALKISFEDVARWLESIFGANISDLTLLLKNGLKLMPIIRKPNYSDLTHDVPIESFKMRVGDKIVSLKEYISNLQLYCPTVSEPTDLYRERDSVILTSTQCCVLPVQKGEKTEFAVQLFNYQSHDNDPAVLVIMVSKDGTSTQVLETKNQKLYYDDNGTARWFSVERLEDVRERQGVKKARVESFKEMKETERLDNTIMIIQIPLVVKTKTRSLMAESCFFESDCAAACVSFPKKKAKMRGHGMDMGQLGLGSEVGPFIGTKGLKLVRDDRYPIRCTYQYYRVTDQNFIHERDVRDIAEQLNQVVKVSVASGSLVLDGESNRKTVADFKNPKPSDNPFTKLDQRDYLPASVVWTGQSMSNF